MDDALKRKLEEHIAAGADRALLRKEILALLQCDATAPQQQTTTAQHTADGRSTADVRQLTADGAADDAAPAHPAADTAKNSVSARSETVPFDSHGGAEGVAGGETGPQPVSTTPLAEKPGLACSKPAASQPPRGKGASQAAKVASEKESGPMPASASPGNGKTGLACSKPAASQPPWGKGASQTAKGAKEKKGDAAKPSSAPQGKSKPGSARSEPVASTSQGGGGASKLRPDLDAKRSAAPSSKAGAGVGKNVPKFAADFWKETAVDTTAVAKAYRANGKGKKNLDVKSKSENDKGKAIVPESETKQLPSDRLSDEIDTAGPQADPEAYENTLMETDPCQSEAGADTGDDEFVTVESCKAKKRRLNASCDGVASSPSPPRPQRETQQAAGRGNKPTGQQPPKERITPLVLEGLSEIERVNPLARRKALEVAAEEVARIVATKRDNVLVFAKSADSRTKLLTLALRAGLSLREPKNRPVIRQSGHMVVIQGVHPTVTDAELSDELGLQCRRIVSASQGGSATWKVRVSCETAEEKAGILKRGGLYIWRQRFRVVDYNGQPKVLRCFKCQGLGDHVAAQCDKALTCSKCSGSHELKDCTEAKSLCANCGGEHSTTSFLCPKMVAAVAKKDTSAVSYANAVKGAGDKLDCTRLACSVSAAVKSILIDRLQLTIDTAQICEDVARSVSHHFKVDVRPAHILSIAFAGAVSGAEETR